MTIAQALDLNGKESKVPLGLLKAGKGMIKISREVILLSSHYRSIYQASTFVPQASPIA